MKRILQYSLIGLILIASSCGSKVTRKYGVKSGIITFSVEIMSEKQVKKVYFEDFGVKETSEVYVNEKLTQKLINKADGFVYLLEADKNTGVKSKHAMATGTEMKFDVSESSIPDSIKKQYHFAKLPNETVCGKDCEVFTTEFQNMKAKYAGWNGIILLTESTMQMGQISMNSKTVAIKFEENVAIPPSVWEVPAGIKMTEQ